MGDTIFSFAKFLYSSYLIFSLNFRSQSSTTVHGALSLMLDSLLCALGPLVYMTSFIPELKTIEPEQMVSCCIYISFY